MFTMMRKNIISHRLARFSDDSDETIRRIGRSIFHFEQQPTCYATARFILHETTLLDNR
jgi:hypothetical protein